MEVTDLHICEGSMKSDSKSKKSECECPPEYYCAEVCGEGYSLSTLISWQHFPRSTSSPSRCAVSTDETRKSVSNSTFWSLKEEEKESTKVSSTEYPITKSISQLKALHYLNIRHVSELLNFLIGHLVCNEPDDPVDFLVDLLGKCIKYRDSFGEPPLLFTHSHIRSLYRAFDPFERDCINLEQYHEAMKTLGLVNNITPYNLEPPVNEEGELSEDTFVFEAERCVIENLKQMFRIPKLWEENRLLWEKKMGFKKAKLALAETERKEKHKREDEISNKICKCFGFGRENVTCRCSTSTTMKYEPKQLYLDT